MPDASPLRRVAVALDTDDWDTFRRWCVRFGPRVGALKVGLEVYVRFGPRAVEAALASGARVFLDLKLHDIPHTVGGAVRAAADLGASWVTVHAGGGARMLDAAVEAREGELALLAVTVLTHLGRGDLEELAWPGTVGSRVERWAEMARARGCQGVVCSPGELPRLRTLLPHPFLLVTPGIRPPGADRDDQRRIAAPADALLAGSDLLVIGRPITRAADPERALDDLERDLSEAASC